MNEIRILQGFKYIPRPEKRIILEIVNKIKMLYKWPQNLKINAKNTIFLPHNRNITYYFKNI